MSPCSRKLCQNRKIFYMHEQHISVSSVTKLFRWMVVFWAQDSCCSHNWAESCLLWEWDMAYKIRSPKNVMLIIVGISGWDWAWATSVTCLIHCVLTDCAQHDRHLLLIKKQGPHSLPIMTSFFFSISNNFPPRSLSNWCGYPYW